MLTSASAPQSPKPTQFFEQQVAVVQPPARVLQGSEARFGSGITPCPLHTFGVEAQVGMVALQQAFSEPLEGKLWNRPLRSGQPQATSFPIHHRTSGFISISFYHVIICKALAPPSQRCESSFSFASDIYVWLFHNTPQKDWIWECQRKLTPTHNAILTRFTQILLTQTLCPTKAITRCSSRTTWNTRRILERRLHSTTIKALASVRAASHTGATATGKGAARRWSQIWIWGKLVPAAHIWCGSTGRDAANVRSALEKWSGESVARHRQRLSK